MNAKSSGIFYPDVTNISNLFCNVNCFYRIPRYQRGYDWGKEQIDKLWDDILNAIESEFQSYFLGPIILVKNDKVDSYDVIDGQQRLTTLTILFSVIRDLYSDLFKGKDKQYLHLINDAIRSSFNKNYRLKLITQLDKQNTFQQEIQEKVIFPSSELTKKEIKYKKFMNAANLFKGFFNKLIEENGEEDLVKVIIYILNQVEVITITCTNSEYAIKLFEILNTRGLNLNPADLIKSYLFSKCTDETKKDQFIATWDQIKTTSKYLDESITNLLTYYLYYLKGQNPKFSLYVELKSEFKSIALNEKINPNKIIYEFKRFVDYYYNDIFLIQSKLFFSFRYLPNQFYWKAILITAKMEEFNEIMDLSSLLRAYYYSYWIAGYTSTKVKQTSFNIISWLKERKNLNFINNRIFEKMKEDDVFERKNKNFEGEGYRSPWLKPVLLLIEYNQTDNLKLAFIEKDKNLHVEHILPQEWKKNSEWANEWEDNEAIKWLNRLGNLTLLSGKKNKEASNFAFQKKKNIYRGHGYSKISAFHITQMINNNKKWNVNEVKERNEYLTNQIYNILKIEYQGEEDQEQNDINSSMKNQSDKVINLSSSSIDFIYNNIKKILKRYSERSSRKVLEYCQNILKLKLKSILIDLNTILKNENRKIIKTHIIDAEQLKDEETKNIKIDVIKQVEPTLNKSRLRRIIKELNPEIVISFDAILHLLFYLEHWLELQIMNAKKKMEEKDTWRKTLLIRDFS